MQLPVVSNDQFLKAYFQSDEVQIWLHVSQTKIHSLGPKCMPSLKLMWRSTDLSDIVSTTLINELPLRCNSSHDHDVFQCFDISFKVPHKTEKFCILTGQVNEVTTVSSWAAVKHRQYYFEDSYVFHDDIFIIS